MIKVEVYNVGAVSSGPVTVTDTLPPGVTAIETGSVTGHWSERPETIELTQGMWECAGNGSGEPPQIDGASWLTCRDPSGLPGGAGDPSLKSQLWIRVQAENGATEDLGSPEDTPEGCLTSLTPRCNRVTVAGGGAPAAASTLDPEPITSASPPFELSGFDVWFSTADGTLDTQAGSHPYAAEFTLNFPTLLTAGRQLTNGGNEARNIEVLLPPGFVGDPTAVPQCPRAEFDASPSGCPPDTQIGVSDAEFFFGSSAQQVYNLVPPPGVPADFGLTLEKINVFIESNVRSGSRYEIDSRATNVPQREIQQSTLIIWGVPGDSTHNRWHSKGIIEEDGGCTEAELEKLQKTGGECTALEGGRPFLTLPTACGAPLEFTIRATSWEHPEAPAVERKVLWHDANDEPMGIKGCGNLSFGPTIMTTPSTGDADSAAGLTAEVEPPLGGIEDPEGLASTDIQDATVALPKEMVINPGQAAGLQACQHGDEAGGDDLPLPGESGAEERFDGPADCPEASKVGTVTVTTPLLPHSLEGDVYVLQSNPPAVELLVAASGEGVNLKLVGTAHLCENIGETFGAEGAEKTCEAPGQLITTFENAPELPAEDFKLSFSGGPQAALDTPTQCGVYSSAAEFTPWASPFVASFSTGSSFAITAGPGGGACTSGSLPFSPSFTTRVSSPKAGGYTNFSLLLQRGDDQQRIEKLQFKTPEGLAGMIANVTLCPEPQASQGSCPQSSQLGHTV
ncbi:MAG TPA: hypothetical protein VL979_15370, partial [Solirubrobacteraceae bacterium]|nr:hypothetical protein [Solirubrobacteraceae bacterium]